MEQVKLKWESALQKYEHSYYRDMPYETGELSYSKRNYHQTLKKLKQTLAVKQDRVATSGKRLAILLAAAISSLVMISAAKKPLTDTFILVYEKYIEFIIRGEQKDAPESIEKVYNAIGYLPKGYYRENVDKTGFSVQTIWRNRENEKLILFQTLHSSVETMMGKESDYEMLFVSDMEVMYIERSGRRFYFWNYEGYPFELSGPLSITKEEYMLMIKNTLRGK